MCLIEREYSGLFVWEGYGIVDTASFLCCHTIVISIILVVLYLFIVPIPGLAGQMQLSGLKKSMTAIPSSPQACGSDWVSPDDAVGRQNFVSTDHAPLSPQSSVASSGSEQTEEQGSARNTFQEDGSGMRGQSLLLNWAVSLFDILL